MNHPVFQPFDQHKAVVIYRRRLPHWRQEGATYFATYRLHDSIPKQVLLSWKQERLAWLNAHGIESAMLEADSWLQAYYKIPLQERRAFERRHYRQFHAYLDKSNGSCCLRDIFYSRIVLESFLFFNSKRCWTGDTVIMPNHVHSLIIPFKGYKLERILQSIKRYSSRQINAYLNREGTLWQKDSYDHIVRDRKELLAFRKYIEKNANQAGHSAGDGAYHRAAWMDKFAEDVGPS